MPRSCLNRDAKPENINLVQQKFVLFFAAVYDFGTDKGKKQVEPGSLFICAATGLTRFSDFVLGHSTPSAFEPDRFTFKLV